jgi:P27 family predicted phage terminase small subunit
MGRRALPSNVHLLRGNPSKLSASDLMDSFQPQVEIPDCPRHLWPAAKKEWKRISPELERYGLISKLDRSALALYCQCYARWVWAEEQLTRAMDAAATARAAAEAKGETYTGGDGVTVPTPNGHLGYSPHWVIANRAMEQVNKYLSAFGLEPCSRGKVQQSNNRQSGLFEDEDDETPTPPADGYAAL